MRTTTIGVFTDRNKTETVIHDLNTAGIAMDEISCVYINKDGQMKDSQSTEKMESSAVTGTVTGGVIGMIAGLVLANGIIPGLGAVLVAGPLVELLGITAVVSTTIVGTVSGAIAGGIIGALVKLGVADKDAAIYEDYLKKGNIVLVTRTDSNMAKTILVKHDATEVREYIEV